VSRIRKILPALLGLLITFCLILLMYKLIDLGDVEVDETPPPQIPDVVHDQREVSENVDEFHADVFDDPVEQPVIPDVKDDIAIPDDEIVFRVPSPNVSETIESPVQRAYIPVYVPRPQYPRRAQSKGAEGYAVVEVTITTIGSVSDPVIIEEWPEGWGFGKAALKAAQKLKYSPKIVDGVPQEVKGVLYKFTFQMAK